MSNQISILDDEVLKGLVRMLRKYMEDFNADASTYHRIKDIVIHGACVTDPKNHKDVYLTAIIELKNADIIPENKDDEIKISRDLEELTSCNNIGIMFSELYFKKANIAHISVNNQQ